MEARDADRAFPPPVVSTPQFASTPAWVTKRGSAPGVPTPLTWAAKSEWPGGMMTPRFDGAGTYTTPEGSWLTGPVPFFDPARENANANANATESNTARALPLTPMSTGRFKADAAAAAASASDDGKENDLDGGSVSKPVSKPVSGVSSSFTPRATSRHARTPHKSASRLSRVLASPARGTERAVMERAEAAESRTPSTAKRSLRETFAPAEEPRGAVDDDMLSVDMMTPSPSRRSGRLDSPAGSTRGKGSLGEPPPANRSARAGTPRRTPPRSAGKGKSASPAAKMQAHALVSLANLREEMEDKERVWGDALAEAEAELAGAKREASEARTELAEEKAKTPEKLRALAEDMLQARETTGISFGETRDADARRRDADTQNIRVSPDTSVSATSPEESVSVSPGGDAESLSVFARAKNASLDREVRRLTERLAAAEAAHARALDVEARKAKARVDAAKEETAAAFAREKDLWAEVHKLRESVESARDDAKRREETAVTRGLETNAAVSEGDQTQTASESSQLKALRSELEQARGAHKEAARRAAAAEASLGAAAEDAERFRLESDALAESLAETTKRLEAASNDKRTKGEKEALEAQKHSAELAQAEDALSEARAALEADDGGAPRRRRRGRRAPTPSRVVPARGGAAVVEDRERLEARLGRCARRERDRREHKQQTRHLETKLEDAERRVAVAEFARSRQQEAEAE